MVILPRILVWNPMHTALVNFVCKNISLLFSDESPGHIIRLEPALACMKDIGFSPVEVKFREGVNTLLVAEKPN